MAHSLLPPNATRFERAVERATARIGDVAVPVDVLLDPQRIPVEWLPWLAWGLSVDNWNADWSEQEKRDAVARSIALHRIKGTRASVESVLSGFDDLLELIEWHEATPRAAPHTFELRLPVGSAGGQRATAAFAEAVIRDVTRVKPVRTHFTMAQTIAVAAGLGIDPRSRVTALGRIDHHARFATEPDWASWLQTEDGEPIAAENGDLLATGAAFFDFSAGQLPRGATLDRSSIATVMGDSSRIIDHAPQMPRFTRTFSGRTGVLLEQAGRNLLSNAAGAGQLYSAGGNLNTVSGEVPPLHVSSVVRKHTRVLATQADSNSGYQSTPAQPAGTYTLSVYLWIPTGQRFSRITIGNDTGPVGIADLTIRDRWQRLSVVVSQASVRGISSLVRATNASGVDGQHFFSTAPAVTATPVVESYIPSTSAVTAVRAADALTLHWASRGVPDGTRLVRYTFDDGTTQTLATTIANGRAVVPPLARPILVRAEAL